MQERKNICAYTQLHFAGPAYVSINREPDGKITCAVRSRNSNVTSEIEVPPEALVSMASAIQSEFSFNRAGFRFDLHRQVRIECSGEVGEVVGRAQYADAGTQYLIRYKNTLGTAVEQWWHESALLPV